MATTTVKLNEVEVVSTFRKTPAYRYIRKSDRLPVETPDIPFEEVKALVKLFNPTGSATWWLTSYDAEYGMAYGVAELGWGPEFGAIYIPELVEFRGQFGLPIERDLHYTPKTVAELLA
jgi:hypothetical protein